MSATLYFNNTNELSSLWWESHASVVKRVCMELGQSDNMNDVVEKILGPKSRLILEVTIALTQFAFAISHIVFLISSWKTTVTSLFGIETEIFPYALTILIIYTSMSWVRNLAKFSFAFILGVVLIIITTVYVIASQDGLSQSRVGQAKVLFS